MFNYEKVHTISDWYDGARSGIADLHGVPHYYENHWDDEKSAWKEIYFLKPIDAETFALAMEDWAIWLRWDQASKNGQATVETHPALPDERARHDELFSVLEELLVIDRKTSLMAKAEFIYGQESKVKWTLVSDNS